MRCMPTLPMGSKALTTLMAFLECNSQATYCCYLVCLPIYPYQLQLQESVGLRRRRSLTLPASPDVSPRVVSVIFAGFHKLVCRSSFIAPARAKNAHRSMILQTRGFNGCSMSRSTDKGCGYPHSGFGQICLALAAVPFDSVDVCL